MRELFFVERGGDGYIVALRGCPQEGRTDPNPLPETNPEIQA